MVNGQVLLSLYICLKALNNPAYSSFSWPGVKTINFNRAKEGCKLHFSQTVWSMPWVLNVLHKYCFDFSALDELRHFGSTSFSRLKFPDPDTFAVNFNRPKVIALGIPF